MHRLTSLFFIGGHLAGELNAHRSTRLPHSRLRLSMVVSGCNFFFFTLQIKNIKPHWATLWFILHQTISQSSISMSRSNHLVSTTAHNLPANCFCFILIWIFAVPSSFIFSTSEHHRTHIQYLLTVESFRTERTLELCGNKYCWNITHQNSERITPPPAVNYTHARFITLHNLQHPYLPCTVNLLLFINILKKVQRYNFTSSHTPSEHRWANRWLSASSQIERYTASSNVIDASFVNILAILAIVPKASTSRTVRGEHPRECDPSQERKWVIPPVA